ncbi:hypothetical protein A0E62_gp08 [Pyrobaculum filamentous virus 1]|uniref:Uncharacterized protein n=1 Tax=Pyrobaculum filamentous virus 1 TaxID=1805492 RepID=A0A140F3J4_PFV1|nr:hypothetical protein A0E62_gp08 [Pyrobaculum filamentous virus 1]AML61154.1 hypothetical protein [Pyrobaculum filamentous virus 1]
MKVIIFFPQEGGKTVRQEVVMLETVDVRNCFEESRKMRSRFVECMYELICHELARKYADAMCGLNPECWNQMYDKYVYSQCEAMRENIEAAVKKLIIDWAELIKECGKRRDCIEAKLGGG